MNESYLTQLDFVLNIISNSVKTTENNRQTVESTRVYAKENGLIVTDKEYRAILFKLKEDGYIRISYKEINVTEQNIQDNFELMATISGLIFNKTGYKKKYRKDLISDIPKNYWWLIAILAWVFGIIGTLATGFISKSKEQSPPSNQGLLYTQSYVDSVLKRKAVHDTIYLPYNSTKK